MTEIPRLHHDDEMRPRRTPSLLEGAVELGFGAAPAPSPESRSIGAAFRHHVGLEQVPPTPPEIAVLVSEGGPPSPVDLA